MHESGPPICCHAYAVPKRGNRESEYEDAHKLAPERGRFAISDGASESWYAGVWARLMVNEYVVNPVNREDQWDRWLPPLRERWSREVGGRPVPWYGVDKVREGAFATLLGLDVGTAGAAGRRWQAVAVGDSCLFLIRDGRLQEAFPVRRSEEFGNKPSLLGSGAGAADGPEPPRGSHAGGECVPGDRIWLMTDALAQWFLQEVEGGGRPWELIGRQLLRARPGEAFATWVEDLRDRAELRNDDVTLVTVDL
jgi:hypothetical protein